MEFACYGKLAITAGEAPYSYMKFNKVFHNKDSYFKYIKKISNIKTINPFAINNSEKNFIFLEMENRNFLNKSKILDQDVHKKFYSLNPKIRKDEYVINKKLFDNLKKYNILNDSYSDNY